MCHRTSHCYTPLFACILFIFTVNRAGCLLMQTLPIKASGNSVFASAFKCSISSHCSFVVIVFHFSYQKNNKISQNFAQTPTLHSPFATAFPRASRTLCFVVTVFYDIQRYRRYRRAIYTLAVGVRGDDHGSGLCTNKSYNKTCKRNAQKILLYVKRERIKSWYYDLALPVISAF